MRTKTARIWTQQINLELEEMALCVLLLWRDADVKQKVKVFQVPPPPFLQQFKREGTLWHYTQVRKSHPEHREFIQSVVLFRAKHEESLPTQKKHSVLETVFSFNIKCNSAEGFPSSFQFFIIFRHHFLQAVLARQVQAVSYTSSSKKSLFCFLFIQWCN